jgi:4-hydroxy-3-polyprenylbenzoate decarboxylase
MTLKDFVELLKKNNELYEINYPVSTELEITEIVDRISKSEHHNKALLFTNNGTSFPLLINAFGSSQRIAYALHANSLDTVEDYIKSLFNIISPPTNLLDKIKLVGKIGKIGSYLPKYKNKKGKCQQIIYLKPDLNILPVLKCWEHDGGKFITLPMVHTINPNTKQLNVGMYRMQIFSSTTTGMHWHLHKTGALHYEESKKKKNSIPVAVCLGGDPVYTYCATAPLPENINEYILAGILRKKAVNLVPCITQPIYVPEDVDIVIEGYINPEEPLTTEGPFGDHTGFYSLPDKYPIFHVTAITHKKEAIYPATIVGIPPQEDYWLIKASERIFLQFLKQTLLHEIEDMQMPEFGVAHNLVLLQIRPRYPKHAYKIAHAMWGIGQMMLNKILIIADDKLNNELFKKIAMLKTWKNRFLLSYGPLDALEHAGIKPLEGGKLMFDATFLNNYETDDSLRNKNITELLSQYFKEGILNTKWQSYSIFTIFTSFKTLNLDELLNIFVSNNIKGEIRIFLLEKELSTFETNYLAWHFLAHFDPSLDFIILSKENIDILIFDGRIKNRNNNKIPNPTISPNHIIQKVNNNWKKYFDIPIINSPSEKFRQLFSGNSFIHEK